MKGVRACSDNKMQLWFIIIREEGRLVCHLQYYVKQSQLHHGSCSCQSVWFRRAKISVLLALNMPCAVFVGDCNLIISVAADVLTLSALGHQQLECGGTYSLSNISSCECPNVVSYQPIVSTHNRRGGNWRYRGATSAIMVPWTSKPHH